MEGDKAKIYDLLVDEKDDFLGIIAYSVYKRQKREACDDFAAKHDGRCPTNEELEPFYALAKSDTQISHFQNEAMRLIEVFCENVLANKETELEREYDDKFQQRCLNLRTGFWKGVWQSVVGSLVFLLAMGLLVFLLWSAKEGPTSALERIFNVQITPAESAIKEKVPAQVAP
ncbi:MAG: hypothetical protein U1F71_20385 [Verrucomicrobiaceae bacterium]